MTGFYRFPRLKWSDKLTARDQLEHVAGEVYEARESLDEYVKTAEDVKQGSDVELDRLFAYGMELMDVIHAAETALRITFDDEEIDGLRMAVIYKNKKRGYYGE